MVREAITAAKKDWVSYLEGLKYGGVVSSWFGKDRYTELKKTAVVKLREFSSRKNWTMKQKNRKGVCWTVRVQSIRRIK